MPLTPATVQTVTNQINALAQRLEAIRQVASTIATGMIWLSPEGTVGVPIPPDQLHQLRALLLDYCAEAQVIIAYLNSNLGEDQP